MLISHPAPDSMTVFASNLQKFLLMPCRQQRLRRAGDVAPTLLTTLALPPSSGVVRWLHQPYQAAGASQEPDIITLLGWIALEHSECQDQPFRWVVWILVLEKLTWKFNKSDHRNMQRAWPTNKIKIVRGLIYSSVQQGGQNRCLADQGAGGWH